MEGSSSGLPLPVRWSLEREMQIYRKENKKFRKFRITQSAMPLFWVYKFFCFSILFPSVEEKMHHIFCSRTPFQVAMLYPSRMNQATEPKFEKTKHQCSRPDSVG